jgi:hypothetical protein
MSLPSSVAIEWLKVNSSPWFPRFFRAHYHPVAPSYWFANRDGLDDTEANVLVEASFYLFLPVNGDGYRCVVGHGAGVGVDHEVDRRSGHLGEGLMFTYVKCAGFVIIQEPLLQSLPGFFCCYKWG